MKKSDKTKRQIINALNNRTMIILKICKSHKPNCYELQIGDTQNMDLVDSKGFTGFINFTMKTILKEIENEMRSLK